MKINKTASHGLCCCQYRRRPNAIQERKRKEEMLDVALPSIYMRNGEKSESKMLNPVGGIDVK